MKAFTLTEFIEQESQYDDEFAEFYAREKVINSIAKMVVGARKESHLTQLQLAERVGTTQSVISRIESGKGSWIPSLDTLIRIAAALNMRLTLNFSAGKV